MPDSFYRAIEERGEVGDRMVETLSCGHRIYFSRQKDRTGQRHWFDENGRRASLNTTTRHCWQCATEER